MTGEVIFLLFFLRQNRSNFQDNDVGSSIIGELPNFSSTFEGGKKENWNTPAVSEKKNIMLIFFFFFWDGMACVSFLRPSFAIANLPPPSSLLFSLFIKPCLHGTVAAEASFQRGEDVGKGECAKCTH